MKILFCIKAMNNRGGGAERVLATVASGLARRGHDVALLSFDRPGGRSFYVLDRRVRRIELGLGDVARRSTVGETLWRIRALRKVAQRERPQAAVGLMHSTFIPLAVALVGTSIPVIASEHIVPAHYKGRQLEAILLSAVPWFVERIVVVSDRVRRSYPRFMSRAMEVIPNPVEVAVTRRADVRGANPGRKVVLTVGRLEPQKDHETLVRAFARVAERRPEWDLRIVGEGGLRRRLEVLVAELGLRGRAALVGAVEDVSREYAGAQLFVCSSRYESFGLVVVEALAHGLPVVGFEDCAGVNDLVRPGVNGLLIEGRGDRVTALTEALDRLLADEGVRVALAPDGYGIPKGHRSEQVLDRWEELLVRTAEGAERGCDAA